MPMWRAVASILGVRTLGLPQAHQQNEVVILSAAAASGRLARGGVTVVYDGVLGPWFLPEFAAATGLGHLHYAVLMPAGMLRRAGAAALRPRGMAGGEQRCRR